MASGVFVTAITCMDGRVQEPVSKWMKQQFAADYVDTITEPGPDGILDDGSVDTIASIRKRMRISVEGHGSQIVAIISHGDCAGNPVSKDKHLGNLERAVRRVCSWGFPVRILGLWVNEDWEVELVHDIEAPQP